MKNARATFLFLAMLVASLTGCSNEDNAAKLEKNARDICRFNLKAIQAAKETWRLEGARPIDETPQDSDIFGPSHSIPTKPTCPKGGTYTLGRAMDYPTCSISGHDL